MRCSPEWIASRSLGKTEHGLAPVFAHLVRSCLELELRKAEAGEFRGVLHHVSATWSGALLCEFQQDELLLTVQLGRSRPAMPRELLAPAWWMP